MRVWNVPDTLEFLKYSFLVEPDEKKIITLEVLQPIDMAFYKIVRNESYLREFSIDGSPQIDHEHNNKLIFFDQPQRVNGFISFMVHGDSLTFPEEIKIQIFYK